jgi:hypothetical protein
MLSSHKEARNMAKGKDPIEQTVQHKLKGIVVQASRRRQARPPGRARQSNEGQGTGSTHTVRSYQQDPQGDTVYHDMRDMRAVFCGLSACTSWCDV